MELALICGCNYNNDELYCDQCEYLEKTDGCKFIEDYHSNKKQIEVMNSVFFKDEKICYPCIISNTCDNMGRWETIIISVSKAKENTKYGTELQ